MTNGDNSGRLNGKSYTTPALYFLRPGKQHEKASGCGRGDGVFRRGLSAQQATTPRERADACRAAEAGRIAPVDQGRRHGPALDGGRRAKPAGRAELRQLPQREEAKQAGGLILAGFDAARSSERPDVAEKMIRKLRTGMMPPPEREAAGRRRSSSRSSTRSKRRSTPRRRCSPNPGWRPFQRLNRAEYRRAVRDLVGIDVDVTAFLPPDTISRGFDNVADVQSFSPTLMESYLRAASQISRLAVGDRNASPTSVTYKIGRTGVADAPRRRRADGHARRHVRRAHLPGRRRIHRQDVDAQRAARRHLRPHDDGDDGHQGAGRGVDQRRARGAGRPQRADERDRSEEQPRDQDAADSHRRRPAADLGGLHPAVRRAARRPARAAREHARRRQHQLRRHGAAAHARHDDPRALRR